MAEEFYDDEEILDEDLLDEEQLDEDEDQAVSAAPAWIISLAIHSLLLLVMSLIVFGSLQKEEEPPIRVASIDAPPPPEEEEKEERTLEEVDITIDSEVITDQPIVTDLDVPVEELSTEDPVEEEAVDPKGREEAVSTSEAGGAMAFMAIGAGGGAAGAFGSRTGGGKKRAVGANGGSRASESAVNAALIWFKKHQSQNGQWDVDGYMDNCQENPKCEPGTSHTADGGDGDSACTGYATLCFLGAGYDHKTPGQFKDTVAKGLEWLKASQNADGTFGKAKRNYENGVCTMALCEAYAMTMDPSLKEPAQKGINALLERQAKTDKYAYGLGWNYAAAMPSRNDSSVTGWCVMALKAGKSAGLDVGNGWEGSKEWLKGAWEASNANHATMDSYAKSNFPYTWDAVAGTPGGAGAARACIGALCAVFLGNRPGDVMLDTMINSIMDSQVPAGYPTNTYYMYYNTLAVFQYGGEKWKDWNNRVRDMLVGAQKGNGTGCFNGSWDYEGTKFHGHETGRLLSTAYCCLSLEVYYRYERVKAKK